MTTGKKLLLALGFALVLYLGVRWVVHALTPDEQRIRNLLVEMEQAYNEGDAGDCVAPLARDWHHEGYELDRRMVLGAVFQASRERDRELGIQLSRVDVDEDGAEVAVAGDHATVSVVATFQRWRKGEWQDSWHFRAHGELVDGDEGWEFVRTRHEDLQGTQLSR